MGSLPTTNDQKPKWVRGPLIVGAGPSGLAAAACLRHLGIPSTILEKSDSIASLWQNRTYDCLKLHLPKNFCRLPLMDFPADFPKYPSKQQFILYMESYAERFGLLPRFRCPVLSARFDPSLGAWRVRTAVDGEELLARWLVAATGENADPVLPDIPGLGRFSGRLIHTSQYKSGEKFAGERVLVVGCGNSGMEVSLDLCRHNAEPFMVVRNNVHVLPREILGFSTFGIAMALLRWAPARLVDKFMLAAAHMVLGNTDRLGLRRPKTGPLELKNLTGKTPVLDVGALARIKSGNIKVMGGIKEITKEGAKFVDGREERFDSIVLATGYKSNVPSWLQGGGDLFSKEGMPKTQFPDGWRGEKGLYCVGFTRRGILGTSSDAEKVAGDIHLQWKMDT